MNKTETMQQSQTKFIASPKNSRVEIRLTVTSQEYSVHIDADNLPQHEGELLLSFLIPIKMGLKDLKKELRKRGLL